MAQSWDKEEGDRVIGLHYDQRSACPMLVCYENRHVDRGSTIILHPGLASYLSFRIQS